MRGALIFILSIALFLTDFAAFAQERSHDDLLDEYEELCDRCLGLRSRLAAGEKVSRSEAQSLIDRFLAMNKVIKSQVKEMPVVKRQRFEAINRWFSSNGQRPQKDPPRIPDVMCQVASPILLEQCMDTVSLDLSRSIDRYKKLHAYALAQISAPYMAYGLMAAFRIDCLGGWYGYGGWIGYKNNFVQVETSYSCHSSGLLDNGRYMWTSGAERNMNMSLCAGPVFRVNKWADLYFGAGYGTRQFAWEDVEGDWALVSDWCYSGFAAELGMLFSWHMLSWSVSVSTVKFHTASLTCGIGVKF